MSQQPIPSPDAYAELRERLGKLLHFREGDHWDIWECKYRFDADCPACVITRDVDALLAELTKLRAEREALRTALKQIADGELSVDIAAQYFAQNELERLAGERT